MRTSTFFDVAYLATHMFGPLGYKMRYGISIVRNMYYLIKQK